MQHTQYRLSFYIFVPRLRLNELLMMDSRLVQLGLCLSTNPSIVKRSHHDYWYHILCQILLAAVLCNILATAWLSTCVFFAPAPCIHVPIISGRCTNKHYGMFKIYPCGSSKWWFVGLVYPSSVCMNLVSNKADLCSGIPCDCGWQCCARFVNPNNCCADRIDYLRAAVLLSSFMIHELLISLFVDLCVVVFV